VENEQGEEIKEYTTKVLVMTERHEFSGHLHRPSADRRETDILNDEKLFVHLTDVVCRTRGEMPMRRVPFVAVNKTNIIFVIPLEEEE
jgi:hypothetical protein